VWPNKLNLVLALAISLIKAALSDAHTFRLEAHRQKINKKWIIFGLSIDGNDTGAACWNYYLVSESRK
jgi:hypothetical protein